tara:strand:+ start:249 stop:767 length:519 start_codon:yes stop_codon:yes gene_type:complete
MTFKSDKQRKKVMAELSKGNLKSATKPAFIGKIKAKEKIIAEKLRKKFRPTEEESRQQRGERIAREAKALKEEKLKSQQLITESEVEAEREAIREKELKARKKLKEIDKKRASRTIIGKAVSETKRLLDNGLDKTISPLENKRKRKVKTSKQTGFFGMDSDKSDDNQDFFHI